MKIDIAAVNSEEVLCSEENMVMFTKEMSISKAAPHASGFGRNVPKYNNAAHYARSTSVIQGESEEMDLFVDAISLGEGGCLDVAFESPSFVQTWVPLT